MLGRAARVRQSVVGDHAITAGRDIGSVTAVDAKAPGALVIGNVAGNVVQGVPEGDGEQVGPTD